MAGDYQGSGREVAGMAEGRPSTDTRPVEGAYNSREGYRQQSFDHNRYQNSGRPNGYDLSNAPKPRSMGPPPGPGDTQSPNGSSPLSPVDGRNGRSRDTTQDLPVRERSRTNGGPGGKSSGALRLCKKCGEQLTGQFVRALGGTFHLDCFRCRDCGDIVASKFFPVDDPENEGQQYPLCETDYFRRLDLLCFDCGGALRGSYITALDRKYHIEHFTCSVCPTVFGAQDSYYEHEGKVYCHYHYSTQFAQRCNGCQTAILKQFVEIFRNGQNQHWHPECYMIHKFWNVRLAPPGVDGNNQIQAEENATEETRTLVRVEEEQMEEKVYRIWSVLSAFEESSAACISDMLLHVSNGSYVEGILVAKKFIAHVDILFGATDRLDFMIVSEGVKSLSYGREAKLLCKKIVAFFSLLSKTQETGVKKLGVTQELLSLVTGLAHYLKLLIRISLQGALKLERERRSIEGLHRFLADLEHLDALKQADERTDLLSDVSNLADQQSDLCHKCKEPIDDECTKLDQQRWHKHHLTCDYCERVLGSETLRDVLWSEKEGQICCRRCHEQDGHALDAVASFESVTRLQQYVYLLRVALARLLSVLRSGGTLPHTSDDPNLTTYDSNEGHRVNQNGQHDPPLLRANSRSKSYGGTGTTAADNNSSSYEQTVGEMKRLRSTRMDTQLSTNLKKARTSRILDGPEGFTRRPGSSGADGSDQNQHGFHIVEDRDANDAPTTTLAFGHQDALTLDDIPRIVAAEQAKEQRPNAYKHAKNQLIGSGGREPKLMGGHQRGVSGAHDLDIPGESAPQRTKRYFSELSALEYFIVRHVAVLSMEPLLEGRYNLEDLLNLIETRKPTFWSKFGKAFQKNDRTRPSKKKGVFGIPLEVLVEKDGVESTYGVGPGALRVPQLIDDTIQAMRGMDMSVEGVFRKNGNIKGLRELTEKLDAEAQVDLSRENPVQVAALLKKFLRELPDPLLTYKLYRLFITSQQIEDEKNRRRVLHLTCCLLPKTHRDSMEILFSFLVWASSFSQVDEESGSKMDTHNLATVITPNILKEKSAVVGQDENSFLAIEVINTLIEYNDEMCLVPDDLQSILMDTSLFNNSSDMTTKEILKRFSDIGRSPAHHPHITDPNHPQAADSAPQPGNTPNAPTSAKAAAPVITHVDTDPYQTPTWPKESSVRHVQGQPQGAPTYPSTSNNTPPARDHEFSNPMSPYHRRGGSSESQASNRSGGPGHAHKYSGWGSKGQPGGPGANGGG